MEIIDLDHWDRKEHYAYFRSVDYPQFNVCANIDVTKFLGFVKKNSLPFYYAMIYAATTEANKITNFRYRIKNNTVTLYDRLHPSFTALNKDNDLFKYVTVDMVGTMSEFAISAQEKAQQQQGLFSAGEERDDLLYMTCLPWISFTHISHTIKLDKDDAIPRISWGKYFSDGDKKLLPLSVQVNHALCDGVHIGQYINNLQRAIDNL